MEKIVIIDALRTPVGKYKGMLSDFQAVELGVAVAKELIHRHETIADKIDYVTFGNVLQAGNGQNPARQIALQAGLSDTVPAVTINEVCGSGLKAISHARQMLLLNEADIILAGGTESMTNAPYVAQYDKQTETYENPKQVMFIDGLTDAFSGQLMGVTAENVAETFTVSRQEQDEFAYLSQKKAAHAQEKQWFKDEMIPFYDKNGQLIEKDEGVRPQTTREKLAELKTVFKQDGTVTAGNASTINDGASAVLLCTKSFAQAHDIAYLAEIEDMVEVGIDPSIMGISPISAIEKLLSRNVLTVQDIDLFEINEAFAASSIVVQKELQLDEAKVNIAGGGISLGHAIGATGARLVTTLIHQLKRTKQHVGVASLCVGGGLGLAMLLRLPETDDQNEKKKAFYKLTPSQRRDKLAKEHGLSQAQQMELANQSLDEELANHLIENQVSEFPIPLGVVKNIRIDDQVKDVLLATEEPSVIAACNYAAKLVNRYGIHTSMPTKYVRGQLIFPNVTQLDELLVLLEQQKEAMIACAHNAQPSIVLRGGGVHAIEVRTLGVDYVSCDLIIDPKEAMGANMVNTMVEAVKEYVASYTNEEIVMGILSNYATEACVTATVTIPFDVVAKSAPGEVVAKKIVAASHAAQLDVYRAVTHNKGIMNGMEAYVLATGNDTRAFSAAVHAYAARSGAYKGLATWEIKENQLVGRIEIPALLGSVGGAISLLPKAKLTAAISDYPTAEEMARITAAIGLIQNLAALRALVSEGIQQGHMSLQARALAMTVGATGNEVAYVVTRLKQGIMNQQMAKQWLDEYRLQQEVQK